ncbi:MAG: outer membrane protein assembly factor [Candidatus Hydrogenedentota bacterium]|nr:MAG: outer membrane protein assembly factor [Candidatus Hydrogenedentota bacterium]
MELEEDGFIADGTFKEELFEKDKEAIIQYYREQGYLDAELTDARWDIRWKDKKEKDERVIVITYKVKEGDRYYFDGYDITWDEKYLNPTTHKPLFTKDQIYHFFEYTNSDIGDVFDYGRFQRDRGIINQLYSQRGYIFARVIPEKTTIVLTKENLDEMANSAIQKEYEAKGIDYYHIQELREILAKSPEKKGRKFIHTRFVIAEGDKGYIENIIIKGNKKTLDKVIRREILVKEGQLFNAALVQRSRERIYNLGFFKEVTVDARPGSAEGKMNLIIEVEEQPTGTISLGGGYGTQTGFSIFTEVSENNLNGTGQRISGRVEFGPQRQAVEASWTEPWLFDKPWSLTLSGFYSHRVLLAPALSVSSSQERATYAKDSFGTSIGIGHRFWINWGHYHRFSPVLSRASDPSSMVADSVYLLVSQGWQLKNTLTNGIYYDNRDNVFNTTQGFRWDTWVDVVGSVLGGDDHYNRYNMIFDYFWWPLDYTFFNLIRKNVLRRWRIVFEHRVSLAFSHETGPVYKTQDKTENAYMEPEDLLLLGGYESLRGWNLYDSLFPTQWQDGGKHRILFTTELRLPVEPNLFWLVLFFDAGALYENPNEFVLTDSTSAATKASISDSALTLKHINLSYFRYSWGFGFRLQIPILPLRLYLAKRLIWDPDRGWFKDHPVNSDFQFVFGIGDRRF